MKCDLNMPAVLNSTFIGVMYCFIKKNIKGFEIRTNTVTISYVSDLSEVYKYIFPDV